MVVIILDRNRVSPLPERNPDLTAVKGNSKKRDACACACYTITVLGILALVIAIFVDMASEHACDENQNKWTIYKISRNSPKTPMYAVHFQEDKIGTILLPNHSNFIIPHSDSYLHQLSFSKKDIEGSKPLWTFQSSVENGTIEYINGKAAFRVKNQNTTWTSSSISDDQIPSVLGLWNTALDFICDFVPADKKDDSMVLCTNNTLTSKENSLALGFMLSYKLT